MSGVGQLEHGLSYNLTGRLRTETNGLVAGRWDDGELLDDVPVEVCTLGFLTNYKIKDSGAEIGQQQGGIRLIVVNIFGKMAGAVFPGQRSAPPRQSWFEHR